MQVKKKRVRIKFSELSKNEKIFRVINLVFMALLSLTCVAFAIYHGIIKDPYNRMVASVTMAVASLAPFLIELIFRIRLNPIIFIGVEIYAAIAGLFGSVLRGYTILPWFDAVVHTIMGYMVAMMGIFIISRLINYKKLNPWLVLLFCFCFSLAIELVWELCEWFSDLFLGQTAQGPKVEGNAPLVTDTMEDILCNTCGAIIFMLHYIIGKFSKASLGIKAIENGLTSQRMKYVELEDGKVVKESFVNSKCEDEEIKEEKNL